MITESVVHKTPAARKAVPKSQSKQPKMAAKSEAEVSSDDAEEQQPSETVQEENVEKEESESKVEDQLPTSQPPSIPSSPATANSPKQEEESSSETASIATPNSSKAKADSSSGTQLSASGRVQRVRQKPKRMNDDFYTDYSGKSWNNSMRGAQKEVIAEVTTVTPVQEKTATPKAVQTGTTAKRRISQTKVTITKPVSPAIIETPTVKEEIPVNIFEDDEDEESETSSSEEEFSSGEEEDDTIYCICRRPYRVQTRKLYMIGCDLCEQWYHGDCVGLPKSDRKKYKDTSAKYFCPDCLRMQAEGLPDEEIHRIINEKFTAWQEKEAAEAALKPKKRKEQAKKRSSSTKQRASSSNKKRSSSSKGRSQSQSSDGDFSAKEERDEDDDDDEFQIEKDLQMDVKATPTKKSSKSSTSKGTPTKSSSASTKQSESDRRLRKLIKERKKALNAKLKMVDDVQGTPTSKSPVKEEESGSAEEEKQSDLQSKAKAKLDFGSSSPSTTSTAETSQSEAKHSKNTSISTLSNQKSELPVKVRKDSTSEEKPLKPAFLARTLSSSSTSEKFKETVKPAAVSRQNSSSHKQPTAPAPKLKRTSSSNASIEKESKKPLLSSSSSKSSESKDSLGSSKPEAKEASKGSESSKKAKTAEGSAKAGVKRTSSVSATSSPKEIRHNFRNAVREIFADRYASLPETDKARITANTEGDAAKVFKRLAAKIDEELWISRGQSATKYLIRSRTLRFNLAAKANSLCRKVLLEKVSPGRLVNMSTDDLATNELKEWREKEKRTSLELIQRDAEEAVKAPCLIVKKTHKGDEEVIVNKTDLIDELPILSSPSENTVQLVTLKNGPSTPTIKKSNSFVAHEAILPLTMPTLTAKSTASSLKTTVQSVHTSLTKTATSTTSAKAIVTAKKVDQTSASQAAASVTALKKPETPSTDPLGLFDLLQDTTAQHNSHVYSNTCRICTGKQPEEQSSKAKGGKQVTNNKKRPSTSTIEKASSSNFNGQSSVEGTASKRVRIETAGEAVESSEQEQVSGSASSINASSEMEAFLNDDGMSLISQMAQKDRSSAEAVVLPSSAQKSVSNNTSGSLNSVARPLSSRTHPCKPIWTGTIFMQSVANFVATARIISGKYFEGLTSEIAPQLNIAGRITHEQVSDYVNRVRECREGIANFSDRTLVLQFNYTTREERTGFDAFHHYFASRNRYAMVSTTGCRIYKEFYLIPLNYDQPAPQVILPLRGPGIQRRKHEKILLGYLIPHARRSGHHHQNNKAANSFAVSGDNEEDHVRVATTPPPRSFTPPLVENNNVSADAGSYTPPSASMSSSRVLQYDPEKVPVVKMIGSGGSSYTVGATSLMNTIMPLSNNMDSDERLLHGQAFVSQPSISSALSAINNIIPITTTASSSVAPDLMDKLKSIQIPSNLDLGEILKNVREKTGQIEQQQNSQQSAEGDKTNKAAVNDPRLMRSAAATTASPSKEAMDVTASQLAITTSTNSSSAVPAMGSALPLAAMDPDELRRLAQEHMARLTSADDGSAGQESMDIEQSYIPQNNIQQQQQTNARFAYPPQQAQQYQQNQQYHGHNMVGQAANFGPHQQRPPPPQSSMYPPFGSQFGQQPMANHPGQMQNQHQRPQQPENASLAPQQKVSFSWKRRR